MIKKGGHNARLRYWINIGSVAEKFAAKTNDVAAISAYIITIIEISCGLPVGKVHHQHAITLTRLIELGMQILAIRSEEHTSELQSLMRISYAVFCLKKKKQLTHT